MDGLIRWWCRPKLLRRHASTGTDDTVHLTLIDIGALGGFGDADDDNESACFVFSPTHTTTAPAVWLEKRATVKSECRPISRVQQCTGPRTLQ